MRYVIDRIPPSNNRFIGRTNFREYQRVKKEWARLIAACCRPRPPEPLERAVVRITYRFPDRRRRDPDNYSGKLLLDGLTAAGILKDDSFGNVTLELRGSYDREHPRTEIEIGEDRDEKPVCTNAQEEKGERNESSDTGGI